MNYIFINVKGVALIFFLFLFSFKAISQTSNKVVFDSISLLRNLSKQKQVFSLDKRIEFAIKSKTLASKINSDSSIILSNRRLTTLYWNTKQYKNYKRVNNENIILSAKTKDSFSFGKAHEKLGLYFYRKTQKTDSAFYHYSQALKAYVSVDHKHNQSVCLLYLSIIQKNEKDFIGSEINSIRGIKILETLKNSNIIEKEKAKFYNNLGLIYYGLGNFNKSIENHKKTIELKENLLGNNKSTIDNSKSNLALAYEDNGNLIEAKGIYDEILSDKNLIKDRPVFYSIVLGNYANCLYRINKENPYSLKYYHQALKISDSLKAYYSTVGLYHDLGQYYLDKKNNDSALYYAKKSKTISKKYRSDDYLKSLLLLSKIENDTKARAYYNEYIHLSDSLLNAERLIRNKFSRIEFETDKVIEEKNQLLKRNTTYVILLAILGIMSTLTYIVFRQRVKNRELALVQEQQQANEEIYNLMLSQQDDIELARTTEKKRISQELHDGILGRLFGTRLNLDSLNNVNTKEASTSRSNCIKELMKIEQDIRKVSHDLNTDFVSGSGFMDIVTTLIETQTKAYNLDYNLNTDENINWDLIPTKTRMHVYRIMQETLQNTYKHAKATHIDIRFLLKKDVILISISDDGIGFDSSKSSKGIGLKNMQDRAKTFNGTYEIESVIGKGTTTAITVLI